MDTTDPSSRSLPCAGWIRPTLESIAPILGMNTIDPSSRRAPCSGWPPSTPRVDRSHRRIDTTDPSSRLLSSPGVVGAVSSEASRATSPCFSGSLSDLLESCEIVGAQSAHCGFIALDPTTQVSAGIKFDELNLGDGECQDYRFALKGPGQVPGFAPGHTLGTSVGLAATKAGNQSLTRANRPSPGFACTTPTRTPIPAIAATPAWPPMPDPSPMRRSTPAWGRTQSWDRTRRPHLPRREPRGRRTLRRRTGRRRAR